MTFFLILLRGQSSSEHLTKTGGDSGGRSHLSPCFTFLSERG
jgi:hypothetical protein